MTIARNITSVINRHCKLHQSRRGLKKLVTGNSETLHRSEHVLVAAALRKAQRDNIIARLLSLYLRLSAALHRFLTHQQPYRGLEIFSKYYQRNEVRTPTRLRRTIVRGLTRDIHAYLRQGRVRVEAKASPSDPYYLLEAVKALVNAQDRGKLPGLLLYLSFVKKPCRKGPGKVDVPRCWPSIKKAAKTLLQVHKIFSNQRLALLARHIVGIDVAGLEKETPNWVFKPFIDNIRHCYSDKLLISIHAGEDYYHVANGLRKIYETIHLIDLRRGDSIGHGLALVMPPSHGFTIGEPRSELLDDLVFLAHYAENRGLTNYSVVAGLQNAAVTLARQIYKKSLDFNTLLDVYQALYAPTTLYSILRGAERPSCRKVASILEKAILKGTMQPDVLPDEMPEEVKETLVQYICAREYIKRGMAYVDPQAVFRRIGRDIYGKLVEEVQSALIDDLKKKGITVEACPTSNIVIRHVEDPARHPLSKLVQREVPVCIGSDDPSALGSDIFNDMALTYATLSENGILDSLREILSCKTRTYFTYSVFNT